MKLSYNWLKEYLKCDLTPQEVADAMTAIGIEVDGVEEQDTVTGRLGGLPIVALRRLDASETGASALNVDDECGDIGTCDIGDSFRHETDSG